MSDLAALISEGERLCARALADYVYPEERDAAERVVQGYALVHLPRLLAVAKAAVEYVEALDEYDHTEDGDFVHERERITVTEAALRAAFDAAAGGKS